MRRSGISSFACLLALACEPQLREQPEPQPELMPVAALDDVDCQACHERSAEQWADSRHHSAFSNADFARSYAREPLDFCRDCHAPGLGRSPALSGPAAEALGVGCIDCHIDPSEPERVHTGLGPAGARSVNERPHALTRSADFGTRSCARCHEFGFPEQSPRPAGTMMQLTMREHRDSPHAARSCASCHMPAGDHGLASVRDPARLRAALEVVAQREGDDLLLELTPRAVGHAFPTGDLYRRLELHAELRDAADGRALVSTTRYLARHFPPRRRSDGSLNERAWHEPVPDDRPRGPTRVRLELDATGLQSPGSAPAQLHWWVDYERVDARDHKAPERSTLASELRLARGQL